MTTRHPVLAVAVALLLLATALRFHHLGAQSFWNDEGNSARLSERDVAAIIEGTAADIHPPLYYLLLRGWRELSGETEFGLRALSAFAGVLTVAATGSIGRGLPGLRRLAAPRLPALVAMLLAATAPVLVYYSQETRMYALLALWAALSTWALLLWRGGGGRGWAAAYVALVSAGLYTHYFFPAVVAGQGLAVLGGWTERETDRSWSRVVRWGLLAAVAFLLYLPWLPIFLRQVGGRSGARLSFLDFAAESGRWLALGATVSRGEAWWALAVTAVLAVLGAVVGRGVRGGRPPAVPLIMLLVPLGLMYLVGATDPAFFKFLLVVVPFLALLMGLAWGAGRRWLWIAAALTVLVVAGHAVSLANLYGDPAFARADYRSIAARVAADGGNIGVILVAPNQWEVFTYYHGDSAPVYPLPRGRPDPAIVEPELAAIAAAHERLYVLFWGEGQRDPEGIIERWLDANAFKASEEWVGDVRFVVYAMPAADATETTSSGATFAGLDGETITLESYAVAPTEARPGDVIGVQLMWRADETPARPYKVFLHLLRADGLPVAQRDTEPGGGSRPTTTWSPGEDVVDNHGLLLPGDLPPGDYALVVGLYDALDPAARLAVEGGDVLPLGVITVTE